ncbi:MAG: S-adenosylmethionine:tRNA ribosyltransferase-isomerase [Coxiellaceae bacterium]|jgi:S-adenosylmethionine:tRNA ribosyltransferase-isomerase|nr:S-adenosylmethionine:tRNA ribosyltransferase-isomerase [Coxiellaceae bacterium]
MNISDFDYKLPKELIAQQPLAKRSNSRLLCLNKTTDTITHHYFKELHKLLSARDLLILNDTKVVPARLYAHKLTGGKVEIFVERIQENNTVLAQTKTSKPLRMGTKLVLTNNTYFEITGYHNKLFILKLHSPYTTETLLRKFGHVPLPPYIKHQPNIYDKKYYQTIYAKHWGGGCCPN